MTLIVNTEQHQPLPSHPDDKRGTPAEERSMHPVNEGGTTADEQSSPPPVGEQASDYKQHLSDPDALAGELNLCLSCTLFQPFFLLSADLISLFYNA